MYKNPLNKGYNIKELMLHFIKHSDGNFLIHKNTAFAPVGVSIVMKYKYFTNDIEIIYNKWFVEGFDFAKKMNLPGTEHHGQLLKGSGVTIFFKKLGNFTFYGDNANDIINACEYGRDIESYMIQNQR